MNLEDIIKEKVEKEGAITIAEYMELALCHSEYGYYMRKDPFGKEGDFTTAPEISQVFGEIMGIWLAYNWQQAGKPEEFALVEMGAGRGTLMSDILRATKNIAGFHEAASIHLVEISPTLKQKQWKNLATKHDNIEWHDSFDTIPSLPIFLIANEFFDALPVRQFVKESDGWHELMVGITDGELDFINSEKIFSEEEIGYYELAGKDRIETCISAVEIISKIAGHIENYGGAAIIIDYGYTGGSNGNSLQAVKYHAYHPFLEDAGNADLTAHVDFAALSKEAAKYNVNIHDIVPQGAFLMKLGAGERTTALCEKATHEQQKLLIKGLSRLADPTEMGSLFKVFIITSNHY